MLDRHPWFELVALTGSAHRVGKTYEETCHWVLTDPMPAAFKDLKIVPTEPENVDADLVFSALPSGVARELEPHFAQAGLGVCTNAGAYRREPDVPVLLPEVNPGHIELIHRQRKNRGWNGFIVTNPNCTSTGMTIALKALHDAFGLETVMAFSMQAISGAGYPGVASLDILDNVIPFISGEEEKVEWEPRKMLGTLNGDGIELAGFAISAHTNRVAVSDGHLVCLTIKLSSPATADEAKSALAGYPLPEACRELPSRPEPVILVRDEASRPQPRLDRMTGGGMTTVVGRVRPDTLFDIRLAVMSHNTIRGAAGGSLLNAELLVSQGYLG
jgi:aspartate-semialdehyde dehydrogenase